MKSTRSRLFLIITCMLAMATASACEQSGSVARAQSQDQPAPAKSSYAGVIDYLNDWIPAQMKKQKVTGLSIAIVDDQNTFWAKGFGYADRDTGRPVTPDTVFRAGSLAKLFTATAVMQLAENEMVDIDKPLQEALPQFSIKSRFPDAAPITPRAMLSHHSGLPSDWLVDTYGSSKPFTEITAALKDEYAAYPPWRVFSYSNVAYTLLGHMIQEVSGKTYADFMENHLLKPLGMIHSTFVLTPGLAAELSKGYQKERAVAKDQTISMIPAGGLYTTAADLGSFIKMVFADGQAGNGRIICPETLAEMLRPQNEHVPLDLDVRIGLGWLLGGQGINYMGRLVQHGGSIDQFFSQLTLLPDTKLGVAVLTNSAAAAGWVEGIAKEALIQTYQAKTGIAPPQPAPEPYFARVTLGELKQYEGNYGTSIGVFTIRAKKDGLYTRLQGRPLKLLPQEGGWFTPRYLLLGLIPIKVPQLAGLRFAFKHIAGHDVIMLSQGEDRVLAGEKLAPYQVSAAWQNRTGSYQAINIGTNAQWIENAQLIYKNGLLIMSVRLHGVGALEFAIRPLSDTEAIVCGLGRSAGETVRVLVKDGTELLVFSGCEFCREKR